MAWISINFRSKALGMPVVMDALVPQGHGDYKSLYLLHGAGGGHSSWALKTRIADYVENKNIAVFMPAGNNKFYVDNVNGKNYFQYITEEVVDKSRQWFSINTDRENTYIAGMSMGGYGAMYAALKRPDLYSKAFSYSGLLNVDERYAIPQGLDIFTPFGKEEDFKNGDFDLKKLIVNKCGEKCGINGGEINNMPNNAINSNVNNSVDNVDNFKNLELIVECGKQDSRLNMSKDFVKFANENGFNTTYFEEDGEHNWKYWDRCIERTIHYILERGSYGSI